MKKKNILKIVLIVIVIIFVCLVGSSVVLAGALGGIGPFAFIRENKLAKAEGNATEYHLENVITEGQSPLTGKNILFLGSSVTEGACSLGVSMADYIEVLDNCNVTKEAVSGTTLATVESNSYVERLLKYDNNESYDLVVVQLSTNDASKELSLGVISDSNDMDSFDTTTIAGAIEYIISYCENMWNCPVVFYTGTKYDSVLYGEMVELLLDIGVKWDIHIIDLWSDADMNAVSDEEYALYMYDSIHPTQAGYLNWWVPKMRPVLYEAITEE